MNPQDGQRLLGDRGTGRWLQRALLALAATGVLVVATVFLTIALIAGTIIALGIGVRLWWKLRKLRANGRTQRALEGEYTVVERVEPLERLER